MAKYVIGIDVGTQGTKAALIREDGDFIAEAFIASRLIQPEPNIVEQDAEEILESCIKTIRCVIEKSKVNSYDIVSLAIDGQMAGIIGIDKQGQAITPYDSWLDQRCGAYWELMHTLGEDKIISLTGCPITYAHGPKILWWKHERPEIYDQIARFVQPAAYAAMCLCDLDAEHSFIDYTYLHFSGFADTQNRCWSEDLLHEAGIEASKMPRILKPYDIIGRISSRMANETLLKEGTPVAAGCGDTAASIFGAGVTQPGMLIDVAGTASVFACAVNKFVPDISNKTLLFAPSVIDGLYTPMAYINGGGLCLKWYKDQILSANNVDIGYDILEKEASDIALGSENLLFVPHFGGRVCPNDGMVRGSWLGLTWRHTRGHLYRSIMEGIGYEYRLYLDIIRHSIPELETKQILAVGGGAKSYLMRQIKADILGIPLTTISRADTGVMGTGIIAGYAVGLFDSLEDTVGKFVQPVSAILPNAKATESYERFCQIYKDNFSILKPIYKNLLK